MSIWKPSSSAVGKLSDYVGVPFVPNSESSIAYLQTMYYHIHGRTFVFPDLDDDFVLTSGAGAWGTGGAFVEIIPADAVDAAFDLHWLNIHTMTEDAEYQVKLYSGLAGTEVEIDPGIRAFRDSTGIAEETTGVQPVQISPQPANTRISAKLFSSNAGTAQASINVKGHRYSV